MPMSKYTTAIGLDVSSSVHISLEVLFHGGSKGLFSWISSFSANARHDVMVTSSTYQDGLSPEFKLFKLSG